MSQLQEIVNANKEGYIQYRYEINEIQSEEAVNKGVKIELFSVDIR